MVERCARTLLPLVVGSFCCLCAMASPPVGTLAYTKHVLEKLVQKELDRGLPSISLSLVKGDQIVWSAAFGYANVGLKAPATAETLYMTASTLKSVTATAILTLVDQGKCKLDDPVNKYLGDKGVEDNPSDSVTVRSLLDHTSGLSDQGGQDGRYQVRVWDRHRPDVASLVDIAPTLKTQEPVGQTWRYNNSAYGLAGLLIEKISGIPYEQYIVENVLVPVGATNTHPITPHAKMVEMMAFNYERLDSGEFQPTEHVYMGFPSAGGARVKAEDMARFLGAHINGGRFNGNQILSKALVDEGHKISKEKYGLGWWSYVDDAGHTRIAGAGRWHSAVTAMLGDKDAKVGAYVMTNIGTTQATFRIADAAIRLLRGEQVNPQGREPVHLEPLQWDRLAGSYKQADGLQITLRRENNSLKFVYPQYQPYNGVIWTYLPASETVLFEPDMGMELEFHENDAGDIEGFTMRQHGFLDYGFTRKISD